MGASEPPEGGTTKPSTACLILLENVSKSDLLSPAQFATLPGGLSGGWLCASWPPTRLDVRPQKDRLACIAVDALDHTIAERLAASDPTNAAWQRDLWVSFWKLADLCEKSSKASKSERLREAQ